MSAAAEIIHVPGVSDFINRTKVPISPAIRANGFIFVSGAPPVNLDTGELVRGDIVVQTEAVMKYLERVLSAAGSSLEKVVKVTIYASNSGYFKVINEVYGRYFTKNFPTRTFVTVASWPMEFDIEIECTALA